MMEKVFNVLFQCRDFQTELMFFTLTPDVALIRNQRTQNTVKKKNDKQFCSFVVFCRNEATRTPDPYVPNVVRYQLRYIPLLKVVPPATENWFV